MKHFISSQKIEFHHFIFCVLKNKPQTENKNHIILSKFNGILLGCKIYVENAENYYKF